MKSQRKETPSKQEADVRVVLWRASLWFSLFCSLSLPALVSLRASFEDYVTGGRATGVDGAMTASSDDVFSLYYNPAAAAFMSAPELGTTVGRLYSGLSDNSDISRSFFGYVYPFHRQAVGVSYTALSLNSLYKEEMIGLSYAWRMGDRFSLGVTGKNYRKTIGHDFNTDNAELNGSARLGVNDPVFRNGYEADAWGGDASMLYRLGNGWRTGLMVRNVNEPNVALGSASSDPAPRSWNWGFAREWKSQAVMLDATRDRFTDMETRLHGGYETWWLDNRLGMRAGGGYGERDYRRVTAGFSYRLSLVQFDYGYIMPFDTVQGTLGTHQISLVFHWGRTESLAAPVMVPLYDQSRLLDLNEMLTDSSLREGEPEQPLSKKEWVDITILPSYAQLKAGGSQQFHARIAGFSDPHIFWTLMPSLGTLSSTGLYQAPAEIYFPQNVWITAKCETAHHQMPYQRVMVHLQPSTDQANLEMHLNFDLDETEIQKVATILEQYPQTRAVIEAHTDNQGSAARGLSVSQERAQAVRSSLIHHFTIAPERLSAQGLGSTRPLASNKTVEGRQSNRRIVVIISAPPAVPDAPPEEETTTRE